MNLEDKWKKAEKELEEFYKMMEKLKPFLKEPDTEVKSQTPYTIEGPIEYPQSYFWS
ncbi:MAG: hypothetical protein NTZ83_04560 [Candidatus Pacearchaeota archaeon]|nr:hypothetical protein [Candidatus Pacearchaeota archaeon]